MIVVAVCAFLLFPFSMTIRELERVRQGRLRAAHEAKIARELGRKTRADALRTLHLAHLKARIAPEHRSRGHVWAMLSVSQPIVRQGETTGLKVEFNLVNETNEGFDPRIPESRIVVNDRELADSGRIMGRTPRTARSQRLLPGEALHFVGALGHHFQEVGAYRVVWEGPGFRSPEVVIRVHPRRPVDP